MNFNELYEIAKATLNPSELSKSSSVGGVVAATITLPSLNMEFT